MEQEENQESNLPVLPRLDRLDRLLQFLEEKHSSSGRHSSNPIVTEMEQEDHCKTISSALEEVHHKGTLMERLATLENRVFQLSLEMDEGDTSRSSSSNVLVSENFGHDSVVPKVSRKDKDEDPPSTQEDASAEECTTEPTGVQSGRKQRRKAYKKWVGWVRMGCN